jgi:TIR domain
MDTGDRTSVPSEDQLEGELVMSETEASPSPAGVKKLKVFVSYASEDSGIAIALSKGLTEHLGSDFASIWIDKEGLRVGFDIDVQLRMELDDTDILLVVYTGQQKPSHGFTGIEVGYFMAVMKNAQNPITPRRIIPFFLDEPPDGAAGISGVSFGIKKSTLAWSHSDYSKSLDSLTDDHPMVLFFRELEIAMDAFRKRVGLGPSETDSADRLKHVRDLLSAIFVLLKKRKEIETNPQRKVVVRVTEPLRPDASELPKTARLVPEGTEKTMSIFGMPEEEVLWEDFLQRAQPRNRYVWKDVIEKVVTSSLSGLEADNSQVVMSHSQAQLYRVILSRSTRFYDGSHEFDLYFVEVVRRDDYGSRDTTTVLKALGLCCRFRFMFFEYDSEFSAHNIRTKSDAEMRGIARSLARELNFLQRDSVQAGLNETKTWALVLEDWPKVEEMYKKYYPIEEEIREATDLILNSNEPDIRSGQEKLAAAIQKLDESFRVDNANCISALAAKMVGVPTKQS